MKPGSRLHWLVVVVTGTIVLASVGFAQGPGDRVPGRYIVTLRDDATSDVVARHHGVARDFTYSKAVNGFAGTVSPSQMKTLAADPRVLSIVPDRVMTAIGKPGGNIIPPQVELVPAGVQRIGAAPGSVSFTGNGIGVAVVDTGLDFNHADLKPLGTASFTAYGTSAQDDNGHGTHVGGIIAARDNAIDVVGVAPEATLYAVKVLDRSGSGSDASVIAGLDWVALNASQLSPRIRVVTMSLGRPGTLDDNPALRTAIQTLTGLDIPVVVAAGNDAGLEVTNEVPATYPEVMAVASSTALNGTNQSRLFNGYIAADTASYFTTDGAFNHGTGIGVTVSAPGEDQENITQKGFIQSTGILSTRLGGGTTRMSGTSMAAPHVTGVVALMCEQALAGGTSIVPEVVRTKIMTAATRIGVAPLNSPVSGYTFDNDREGILSAPGALAP